MKNLIIKDLKNIRVIFNILYPYNDFWIFSFFYRLTERLDMIFLIK